MAQQYLDTSIRRIPLKFYSRTLVEAAANRKKPEYTELENVSLCSFKTKGGTPVVIDGVLTILSTAEAVLFYRDDIKRGDRVECLVDSSMWEILHVENIDMQNHDIKLTLQSVEGVK